MSTSLSVVDLVKHYRVGGGPFARRAAVVPDLLLEAAAVGIPDEYYGQEIMACIVLKPGRACSAEELRRFADLPTCRLEGQLFADQLRSNPSSQAGDTCL